jgi:hypothetical protein
MSVLFPAAYGPPYVFDRRLRVVCLHGLQSLPSAFIVATRNACVTLRTFPAPMTGAMANLIARGVDDNLDHRTARVSRRNGAPFLPDQSTRICTRFQSKSCDSLRKRL